MPPEATPTVLELIWQLVDQNMNLIGLVLLAISQYRTHEIERTEKRDEIQRVRESKNEEIKRLQDHNDKLLLWCTSKRDDMPPMPE